MSDNDEPLILSQWIYQLTAPPASVARVARRAAILRICISPLGWELTAPAILCPFWGKRKW